MYNSLWIWVMRAMFQQMDSWWNTLLRKALKEFNGAETVFRFLSDLGKYGYALLSDFQRISSYSALKSDTQKPNVSSDMILDGVTTSCLLRICFVAQPKRSLSSFNCIL